MSNARSYVLDSQFDRIARGMRLRKPQRDSLRVIHEIVGALPGGLATLSTNEVLQAAREHDPNWRFPHGHLELTFALATGVGKTRLAGAIMAYLYRTNESRNFVILAPRDAILRKFEEEVREASSKYIFVDRGLIPQPRVCHRGNILDFNPRSQLEELLPTGPNIFVFSPQLLIAEGRVSEPLPHLGYSILDYLKGCDDLVVFIDESHHLSPGGFDQDERSWGQAVRELAPKLACALTATPRDGSDVAYEYELKQCLRDGIHTKAVRLIVDKRAPQLTETEYDEFTLDVALDRLQAKSEAIESIRKTMPAFPEVRPLLLIAAQDTAHADWVHSWFVSERGFSQDEVLVIHSKRKTEIDLQRLAEIERPGNRVRIVVQVHVLDEGWDVTNVYVIAPLRNVQSFINARQVMGRGLRLPMGNRVDDLEVDTLDVLAFGQETFAEVYAQATDSFGDAVSVARNGRLRPHGNSGTLIGDGDAPDSRQWELQVDVRTAWEFEYPLLDMIPPEPDLEVSILRKDGIGATRHAFDLGSLETDSIAGAFAMPRERFVRVCIETILSEFDPLSAPLHDQLLRKILEEMLGPGTDSEIVSLDPVLAAKLVVDALASRYVVRSPSYVNTELRDQVTMKAAKMWVPETVQQPLAFASLERWTRRAHFRIPISGWRRCTHEAARFDTEPEFVIASRLDNMKDVKLWLRNDPAHFRVQTIAREARMTAPDFLVLVEEAGAEKIVLLEVKGEHLWLPPSSDARVHARDIALWSAAANATLGHELFLSRVILGGDVSDVTSIANLQELNAI